MSKGHPAPRAQLLRPCGKTPAGKPSRDSPAGGSPDRAFQGCAGTGSSSPRGCPCQAPQGCVGTGDSFPGDPVGLSVQPRGSPEPQPSGIGQGTGKLGLGCARGKLLLSSHSCPRSLPWIPSRLRSPAAFPCGSVLCHWGREQGGGAGGCGTVTRAASGNQPGPCHFPSGTAGCGMCIPGCPCGDVSVKRIPGCEADEGLERFTGGSSGTVPWERPVSSSWLGWLLAEGTGGGTDGLRKGGWRNG